MALFGRETEQEKARVEVYTRWLQSQNVLAIISLVLGVFSLIEFGALIIFGVGGIICGVIALRQLNRPDAGSRNRGSGLAIGGIVTSAISLVIAALIYLRVFG